MTRQAITTGGAPARHRPVQPGDRRSTASCSAAASSASTRRRASSLEGVEAQAERSLRNLTAVLDAAGLAWPDVVKTTIFLADIGDFAAVNAVYGRFMPDPPPARSTVAGRGAAQGRPRRDRGHRPAPRAG